MGREALGIGGGLDTLGARLRAIRTARKMTLRQLADRAQVSKAFISQVERDEASPSVASLAKIAAGLSMSMAELLVPSMQPAEGLVRASERARMALRPGEHFDEVLSPSLHGRLLVLQSTIHPGAGSGPPYHHPADEECVVVVHGRLEVRVEDQLYDLGPGDALTYSSRRLHAWRNATDEDVVALWVITPPDY